ncbi:Ig-like domain-containing protein [Candidatus Palauibacter sp.]|uniref:Ig-like domain-containing protein n=1 Tax=Candidatus Palauibacter sp. TaxID=3101350 RepID=UPI003B51DBCE
MGTIPDHTVSAGETATVDVSPYFRDPDGDALSYAAASSLAGVVGVSVAGGSVTVTALAKGAGTVTVEARDPQGRLAQQRFQVTVPNRAPEAVGTIPAQTVFVGETASVDVSAHFRDPDGDPLTYSATPSNADVVAATVTAATITIRALGSGVTTVSVTAEDPDGGTAEQVIPVTVPNRGPLAVGSIPARTISVGETETVEVASYFSDPDGDALSYEAMSSNAGIADVSVADGSVTVTALARGVVTVTVAARDPQDLIAQQRFQVTVPNRAPEAVGTIPVQTVFAGETASVDASAYFRDPDGDPLTYSSTSSAAGVVSASVSGSTLTLTGVAAGTATVTVTASDPDGLDAVSSFGVTVENPSTGSFQIELVFATSVTRSQEAAFHAAAERWMRILAPTELPDRQPNRTLTCGTDSRFERYVETIDDLMIVAAVGEIDGPGGTLGRAGPCWVRRGATANYMPYYGRMEFDEADIERMERVGDMEDVILHEMGHVLGIGTIWEALGLLRNPASETESPDTHFVGPLAIEAFDEAGGTSYSGGTKVPVDNTGGPGTWNGHWRHEVFAMELMIGYADGTATRSPVSAITIQSLADLGYAVDVTAADPYRLPDADAARLIDEARLVPYGNDIWRGPIVVVDPEGRIVRIIPG